MLPSPIITMDFETYSESGYLFNDKKQRWTPLNNANKSGLIHVGAYIYATHPSTRVICLSYDMHDGKPIRLWIPGMSLPEEPFKHIKNGLYVEAHNAEFEYYIWNFCFKKYDASIPVLEPKQLRCSAAKARAAGLPAKLAEIPAALGSEKYKDPKGERLIKLLSCPRNPTETHPGNTRRLPVDYPEEFSDMYLYCMQDVATERDISKRLANLSQTEQELWQLNLEINRHGVTIDTAALDGCIKEYERIARELTKELVQITEGAVTSHAENKKIIDWLKKQNVFTESIDASHIKNLLSRSDLSNKTQRVLEIRQTLAPSSVKKLYSIRNRLDENNRIHDQYIFKGAGRTGRFSGVGPQPQNIPRSGTSRVYRDSTTGLYHDSLVLKSDTDYEVEWGPDVADQILSMVSSIPDYPLAHWKNPIRAISGSLRGLLIASPGKEFVSSDYSAIEARVLAELAGETWRQELFKGDGKIYEASGSKITGVPFDKIDKTHYARKIGKVAELASGYCGWIHAWKRFNADKFMSDEEIKRAILKWREASPAIVELWGGQWRKNPNEWSFTPDFYGLEGAAVKAILQPGSTHRYRYISYVVEDDVLYCSLPSGRRLAYRNPRLTEITDRCGQHTYQLSFMGWNTNIKNGPPGWIRISTYGGKLAENVTQATAGDVFMAGMLRVWKHGKYQIVLQSHDELTTEVPEGTGDIKELEELMCVREKWFSDWPIKASGGWIGKRYRK